MRRALVFSFACLLAGQASAQMVLPGATAPAPVGSVVPPVASKARPRASASTVVVAPTAPSESALGGKTLYLNGGKSLMAFSPHDKTVDLARLTLTGTRLSNRREECEVDVAGLPLALVSLGQADGLRQFTIPVPACPIKFDVLDGAVLVSRAMPVCAFTEADCEVTPGGLWGPTAGDIGPDQVKTIERDRIRAESSVRSSYKALVESTKDRAAIKGFASDQAGFSSAREETCRDYIGEARHGFCASRLTEARAATLGTALSGASALKALRKRKSPNAKT